MNTNIELEFKRLHRERLDKLRRVATAYALSMRHCPAWLKIAGVPNIMRYMRDDVYPNGTKAEAMPVKACGHHLHCNCAPMAAAAATWPTGGMTGAIRHEGETNIQGLSAKLRSRGIELTMLGGSTKRGCVLRSRGKSKACVKLMYPFDVKDYTEAMNRMMHDLASEGGAS